MENSIDKLYKTIYAGCCFIGIPLIPIILRLEGWIGMLGILGFTLILVYLSYYSISLLRALPGRVPLIFFWIGTFVVLGGASIDMFVTALCSPDLAREGNYMVLMLFKMNSPLWFIYLFLIVLEIIMSILIVSLWSCFLKSYSNMMYRIPYKNLTTTFKWVLGIGKISVLDFFLFRNFDAYFTISLAGVVVVALQLLHWYVALEWLEFVPIVTNFRITALLSILFITIMSLVLWTHDRLKKNHNIALNA